MAHPDLADSFPRKRSIDWPDPSSAWAPDESGAMTAAASEPYDWTLKDGAIRTTQVIPITSQIREGSAKSQWPKRKAGLSEPSTMPLDKSATSKLFSKGLTRFIRPTETSPLVKSDKAENARKYPGLALPLLLLSVIALFVFAYIAQK